MGATSARPADAGGTGGSHTKGGENSPRLLFAARGTFYFTVFIGYFAVGFKLFAAVCAFIFIDWHLFHPHPGPLPSRERVKVFSKRGAAPLKLPILISVLWLPARICWLPRYSSRNAH